MKKKVKYFGFWKNENVMFEVEYLHNFNFKEGITTGFYSKKELWYKQSFSKNRQHGIDLEFLYNDMKYFIK